MGAFLDSQLTIISEFGSNYIFITIFILFVSAILYKNNFKTDSFVNLLVVLSYPFSLLIKYIYKHPRPILSNETGLFYLDNYSFPSSHVIVYTALFGYLFYLTFLHIKKAKIFLHVVRWVCLYFILTIGISRVYLDAHFLRDVIGGYFYGIAYLAFLIITQKVINNRVVKNKA